MKIDHILFDMSGTLVETKKFDECAFQNMIRMLALRFGGTPADWRTANEQIQNNWQEFFGDLDLSGANAASQIWDGHIRVSRALFNLAGRPEPPMAVLSDLVRELPYQTTNRCKSLYPEVALVIATLYDNGFRLGIATHILSGQVRGALEGGEVMQYFAGPFLCPDVIGRFIKNAEFFADANLQPDACLVVDDQLEGVRGAQEAGMNALFVNRKGEVPPPDVDSIADLTGILTYLNV
jgi:FMN phosphatase YigB (HAD superfamily)